MHATISESRKKIIKLLNKFFLHRPSREELLKKKILREEDVNYYKNDKKCTKKPTNVPAVKRVRKLSKCAATIPMLEQVTLNKEEEQEQQNNENNNGSTTHRSNNGNNTGDRDKDNCGGNSNSNNNNNLCNNYIKNSNNKQIDPPKYELSCYPRNSSYKHGEYSPTREILPYRNASTGTIVTPPHLRRKPKPAPSSLREKAQRRSTSPACPMRNFPTPFFDSMMTTVDWSES